MGSRPGARKRKRKELEAGVQDAIAQLSGYFRRKLPLRLAQRPGWLFRHPGLVRSIISGLFAKRDISSKVETIN